VSTSIFRTQKACTAGARRRRGRWAVPTKTNKCPPSLRPSLRCPSFAAPPPQVRHRAALWCGVSPSLRVVSTVVSPSSIRRVPLPTYMHEKISFELLLERSAPLWPTSPAHSADRTRLPPQAQFSQLCHLYYHGHAASHQSSTMRYEYATRRGDEDLLFFATTERSIVAQDLLCVCVCPGERETRGHITVWNATAPVE
jgi:hypothetical protein